MRFNKKAVAASEMFAPDTIIFWIIFGVVLGFVAIIFVLLVSKSGAEKAKIYENLETLNLMQRFLKSPDCFIYSENGRAFTSQIGFDKFTDGRLNSCYSTSSKEMPAFRIILSSDIEDLNKAIKTTNWNENRNYEEKVSREVQIVWQNKVQNGNIEVQVQNVR